MSEQIDFLPCEMIAELMHLNIRSRQYAHSQYLKLTTSVYAMDGLGLGVAYGVEHFIFRVIQHGEY